MLFRISFQPLLLTDDKDRNIRLPVVQYPRGVDGIGLFHKLFRMNAELFELRHSLHREPELSGAEYRTAEILEYFLKNTKPDRLVTGVGGNGILAVFQGLKPGIEILLRCDMDAVPVQEELRADYCSATPGIAHKCGHDGHMAIMAGVASRLSAAPPEKGRVLLLFQPGEETGSGARMVIEDRAFEEFHPDLVLALHNLPGFPAGSVVTASGPFAEASRGLVARLKGKSSHAGEPLLGISPAPAVASLIRGFEDLCIHDRGILVTLIHVVIGEPAFGTSPCDAVVMATLRAPTGGQMESLSDSVLALVSEVSEKNRLEFETEWTEEFPATVNSPEADSLIRDSAANLGLEIITLQKPFPWSEDFGHFTGKFGGALFGLGAGIGIPPLHSPMYDFPDQLIDTGIELFMNMIERTPGIEE